MERTTPQGLGPSMVFGRCKPGKTAGPPSRSPPTSTVWSLWVPTTVQGGSSAAPSPSRRAPQRGFWVPSHLKEPNLRSRTAGWVAFSLSRDRKNKKCPKVRESVFGTFSLGPSQHVAVGVKRGFRKIFFCPGCGLYRAVPNPQNLRWYW